MDLNMQRSTPYNTWELKLIFQTKKSKFKWEHNLLCSLNLELCFEELIDSQ